ncbi:hypothetical protein FXO37_05136 [Capsicum annuum]|nr:hypothetical protein FXO37_05136 [Capsicum annuum]
MMAGKGLGSEYCGDLSFHEVPSDTIVASSSTLPGDFSEVASELVICCMRTPQSADFPAASGEDEADGELLVHMLLDHYNLT